MTQLAGADIIRKRLTSIILGERAVHEEQAHGFAAGGLIAVAGDREVALCLLRIPFYAAMVSCVYDTDISARIQTAFAILACSAKQAERPYIIDVDAPAIIVGATQKGAAKRFVGIASSSQEADTSRRILGNVFALGKILAQSCATSQISVVAGLRKKFDCLLMPVFVSGLLRIVVAIR